MILWYYDINKVPPPQKQQKLIFGMENDKEYVCFGHENCLQTQDNKCVSDLWSTELARSDHRRTCQLSLPIAVAGWSLCFLFEDPYRICVSSSAWTRLGMFLPGTPLETSVLQRNNSAQWIEMASKICSKNHENKTFAPSKELVHDSMCIWVAVTCFV